jgi:hypothetical protein
MNTRINYKGYAGFVSELITVETAMNYADKADSAIAKMIESGNEVMQVVFFPNCVQVHSKKISKGTCGGSLKVIELVC